MRKNVRLKLPVLMVLLSAMILLTTGSDVYAASGEGHWIDITWYYFSSGRVMVAVNHDSSASIGNIWLSDYVRRIEWQDFGGDVNYHGATDLCNGYFNWLKASTYYQDDYGQHVISGWYQTPTWCNYGEACKNYHSDTNYWTYSYSPRGVFRSQTKFGNSCFPNVGPIRTIEIGF